MLLLCAFVSAGAYAQGTTPSGDGDYEDRLIDDGNLAPDFADDIGGGGDPEGWPRAFRMQLATSRLTRNDRQINESGIRLGGMLDTPNYGAFTLDANLRSSNSDLIGSGGLVSLWQRGLPMNGGWFANNALGVFNSPSIDLARQQYRFFIPTIPTVGAATEWRQAGGLQFQTSVGQPGLFTGLYTSTFEGLGGRAATGGMQWNLSREWAAAVQAVDVDRARFTLSPTALGATVSARSWYGASAWTTPGARAQLNVVSSEVDGGSERTGAWLDGGIRDNLLWHTFGGFRLPSNLVWGNQPLPSNLQGGYYRAAYQSRQWIVDGGVDYVMPVSGGGSGTLYAIGNARYQMLTGLGVGGGANVRQGAGDAWSAFGFVDHANPWGLGRIQTNFAKDDFQNNTLLTLDQSWRVPSGARLSTSLLLGRENFERYGANRYGVAVYGGGQLRSNLSVDINARWDEAFGQASSQNVLANAALNWGIASGWIASASYYENRNTGRLPLVVTSPIPEPFPLYQRLNDRGVFLSLRYDWQAGTPVVPLGGQPGTGSGTVAGVLFLDANDNGRLDAGEAGAPNVTILLDGRFTVRTDSQGRFEFASVAAGKHVLGIVPDNLPLPWAVPADGRIEVEVGVRDRTRTEIPVRRLR